MLRETKCVLCCVHNIVLLQIHAYLWQDVVITKGFSLSLSPRIFSIRTIPSKGNTSWKSCYIVLKQKVAKKEMFMQFFETLQK